MRLASFLRMLALAGVSASLVATGCAHDVVLPDVPVDSVCGDGVIQPGEECDAQSPGCVDCKVIPGWLCNRSGCSVICGDGVVGDGANCTNPRREGAACDLNGYWVSRETDFTRDQVLGAVQTSTSWVLYRLSQSGDAFQVEEAILCGTHTTGSATVDFTPGTLRYAMWANRLDPAGKHGPRKGTFRANGAGCALTFDRWYQLLGGVEDQFLPADFSLKTDLNQLPKLPFEADPVNPTGANTAGALDVSGDGHLGNAERLSGFVGGVRYSIEREWKEYASTNVIPPNAIDVIAPGAWDAQVSVLRVADCGGACGLVAAGAYAAKDIPSRVTLHFLGRTLGSARVGAVIKGAFRQSADTDLASCANARLALPHDTSQAVP